jgi:hypothetical protein
MSSDRFSIFRTEARLPMKLSVVIMQAGSYSDTDSN